MPSSGRKPVVWAIMVREDRDPAPIEAYGEVRAVFPCGADPFQKGRQIRQIARCIEDSREHDYFLPMGPTITCWLFAQSWLMVYPTLRVLCFSRRSNRYDPIEFSRETFSPIWELAEKMPKT